MKLNFLYAGTSAPFSMPRMPEERYACKLILSQTLRCSLLSVFLAALALFTSAQESKRSTEQKQQPPTSMGIATGTAHSAVKDAQQRPITAGGFVENGPIVFMDITKQGGLDRFLHRSGTPQKETILETMGSGVALLDFDNDGWLDIYLVNGSTFAATKGKEPQPRAMLLHNNHDGTFTD